MKSGHNIPIEIREQKAWLKSLSDEELSGQIQALRSEAKAELLPELIERWYHTDNKKLRQELFEMFKDSRDQNVVQYFLTAIECGNYHDRASDLMSVLWQAPLDMTSHFSRLVKAGMTCDENTLLELGTIIENLNTPVNPEDVSFTLDMIDEILEEKPKRNRTMMLENLRMIIGDLETSS